MSASETKKCPRRVAQVLNYAKLDKKGFQSLKGNKVKSRVKQVQVTCSPGSRVGG